MEYAAKPLQTDPKMVAKLAKEREDDNWRFRTFLKGIDLELAELDAMVHRLCDEVAGRIDCHACGNCCREILPALDDSDVSRLAIGLGVTADEIAAQYLMRDEQGDLTFNRRPCPFFEGNRCRVYEHRPETCRSYHLQKDEFVFRLAQAVGNCSVCPIVFNVFDRLKAELWQRPDTAPEEEPKWQRRIQRPLRR